MDEYWLPERVIDLDAVTEMLYENGNLAEEVYRALGGGALPFYTMLGEGSGLAAGLRAAAEAYLVGLAKVFTEHGVYSKEEKPVVPRELKVKRLTPTVHGKRSVFMEAPIA